MVDYNKINYYNQPWKANIGYYTSSPSITTSSQLNYTPYPMIGAQTPWLNSVWTPYSTPMMSYPLSSNEGTPTQTDFETVEQYNERMQKEAIAKQKEAQDRAQNGYIAIENGEIKLDDKTRKEIKEGED